MKDFDKFLLGIVGIAFIYYAYNNYSNNLIANLPATGQDMTIIFILLGLAVCGILLFLFLKRRKNDDEE